LSSLILFPLFVTSAIDNGDKITNGVVNIGGYMQWVSLTLATKLSPVSLTPVANLAPVSTTPWVPVRKCTAGDVISGAP
jgi:hypothetical protein